MKRAPGLPMSIFPERVRMTVVSSAWTETNLIWLGGSTGLCPFRRISLTFIGPGGENFVVLLGP